MEWLILLKAVSELIKLLELPKFHELSFLRSGNTTNYSKKTIMGNVLSVHGLINN